MTRTIEGVVLESQGTDDKQWHGTLDGEEWVFFFTGTSTWQGFTKDHLTGTPNHLTLAGCVRWVLAHRQDIEQKLLVRRSNGTRLVDPT